MRKLNIDDQKAFAFYKKGNTGSFATAIIRAYELADLENQKALEQIMPEIAKSYWKWFSSDNPYKCLEEMLRG